MTEDLEPLDNPELDFKRAIILLNSSEESSWIGQFDGCNTLRRLSKHHSSILLQQGVA